MGQHSWTGFRKREIKKKRGETDLPVPLVHNPRDLNLLSPHLAVLFGLSDTPRISEKHLRSSSSTPLAHCTLPSSSSLLPLALSRPLFHFTRPHHYLWGEIGREKARRRAGVSDIRTHRKCYMADESRSSVLYWLPLGERIWEEGLWWFLISPPAPQRTAGTQPTAAVTQHNTTQHTVLSSVLLRFKTYIFCNW